MVITSEAILEAQREVIVTPEDRKKANLLLKKELGVVSEGYYSLVHCFFDGQEADARWEFARVDERIQTLAILCECVRQRRVNVLAFAEGAPAQLENGVGQ